MAITRIGVNTSSLHRTSNEFTQRLREINCDSYYVYYLARDESI